ncbi:MAG TPA: PBP1A family penicillin-binding protein [Alphaproteobacteria bacterium]|nr:PBP1A family penicillin-binding protein [Alphaproteobacteria bacterium]
MKRDNDRRSPRGRSRERGDDDWGRPKLSVKGARSSNKRTRSPKKRWRLLRWAAVAAIWIFVGLAAFVGWCAYDLPEADNIPALTRRPQVTILARDGTMFLRLGESAGPVVDAKDLPPYLIDAVVATEDRRFFHHFGLDPIGMARALLVDIREGRAVAGGSTITQQLAKNLFLSPRRTLTRKVQEAILALEIEHRFTKDQILTMYLNRVYLGAGAFGISAAAHTYFGKDPRDLNLIESAVIAGLLKAPSRFSPARDVDLARQRAGVVLERMTEEGYITTAQAAAARKAPLELARQPDNIGRYFADWAVEAVKSYIGGAARDIVVKTTLDINLQKSAESRMKAMLAGPGAKAHVGQGALVAMAPDGAVRAMVGGADWNVSPFNRAPQALRQPGSAFKAIVYLAGMDAGLTPETKILDAPIKIGTFAPKNFEKRYRGLVTLREAFAESINTVAVAVLERAGIDNVIKWAQRLGITTPMKREMGLALGASEVTLLELTAAYVPFENGGTPIWPYGVSEITDETGKVLYQRMGSGPGLTIDPKLVAEMDDLLRAVVTGGTGRAARLDRPTFGKTGTSEDYRDAWFVGYAGDLITGVWLGNDDGAPMKNVTGGTLPARLWHSFMTDAEAHWPKPAPPPKARSFWDFLFGR